MSKSLQTGLYELCKIRIAQDEEFRAAAKHRSFDRVDDALFDEYSLWQLKKTVALVEEKSPFYRRCYSAAGVGAKDIATIQDLAKLPLTSPAGLCESSYSFLCTSQSQVEKPVTFYSSGSTGAKKRIFFSAADIQRILDFLPRGMNTVIDPQDARVQVFLQNTLGRGIGNILADSLRRYGMQAWTSDLQDETDDILRLTLDHRVNIWFGDAMTILRATRVLARRMDLHALGMRCIFITMMNISDSMIAYLEKAWGCRVSTHYGLTESGWGLAVDCDTCPGYHYNELDHLIEIVDPTTGAVLPHGVHGEVVLTNLARDCMPLVRYRTGDIAALFESRCGSHLEVLGHIERRLEGAYLLGGREVYPALLDETLFKNEDVLDYRVFSDGAQLFLDVEVLEPERFDAQALGRELGKLDALRESPVPEIRAVPCGTLREFAFEKKRILPYTK